MRMMIAAATLAALFNSAGAACEPLKQEMLIGLLVCKAAGAYDGLKPSHDKALLALMAAPGGAGAGAIGQDGMLFCARAAAQFLVAQNHPACRVAEPARTVQRPAAIAPANRQMLAAACDAHRPATRC